MRLQRILLLRDLGLGHPGDRRGARRADATTRARCAPTCEWLQQEQERLDRQIASVERTIDELEGGEQLMAENMFDGFDHTAYKDEVEQRWGKDAYAKSDAWWRAMTRRREGRSGRLAAAAAASRTGSPRREPASRPTATRRRRWRSVTSTG